MTAPAPDVDRERVLRRVRALLDLARNNPEPHEAALAAAKASSLMREHAIAEVVLGQAGQEDAVVDVDLFDVGGNRISSWRNYLAGVLAHDHGAAVYWRAGILRAIGRPDDCRAVRCLYEPLQDAVEQLSRQHAKGRGKRYANSFRLGVVYRIEQEVKAERLRQERERWADRGRLSALVIIDEREKHAHAHLFGVVKPHVGRNRLSVDGAAAAAGIDAGRGVFGLATRPRVAP
ncbi:MAG: DUF2786 domain-containing protein [Planctomycetota bacterium]